MLQMRSGGRLAELASDGIVTNADPRSGNPGTKTRHGHTNPIGDCGIGVPFRKKLQEFPVTAVCFAFHPGDAVGDDYWFVSRRSRRTRRNRMQIDEGTMMIPSLASAIPLQATNLL